MGLLERMGWADPEPEKTEHIDAEQDLTPQMKNVSGRAPINVLGPTPGVHNTPITNTMFAAGAQPQLTEADKTKWQDFCMNLYTEARKANPLYDKFLKAYDAVASLPIQEAQKISTAAAMLKNEGITKAQIIQAVQSAQKAVLDGRAAFEQNHAQKVKVQIEDVQTLMNDKQTQINNLQQDITKLAQNLQDNNAGLSMRLMGFNTYFAQVNDKLNADVQNTTAFIPD